MRRVRKFLTQYREALRIGWADSGVAGVVIAWIFFPPLYVLFRNIQEDFRPTP